jgi:hypothetical protein
MGDETESRPRAEEFVRIENEHVRLARPGVLKIGPLSIDFHHRGAGGVIGFDAYCCKNDFSDCVLRKDGATNCADSDRPITVWKFE